jgi:hypothetical protein
VDSDKLQGTITENKTLFFEETIEISRDGWITESYKMCIVKIWGEEKEKRDSDSVFTF